MVSGKKFPVITHPLSRLGRRESLSINGRSNDGTKSVNCPTRSVFLQPPPDKPRSQSVCGTTFLDQESSQKSVVTPRCVTSQGGQRISTNEVIITLEEKLKHNNIPFVKQLFRSNDPNSEGMVNKEAFSRILRQLCGYLTSRQFNNILRRMNLERNSSIKLEDLLNYFGEGVCSENHDKRLAKEAQWITSTNSATDQILTQNSVPLSRSHINDKNKTDIADQAWKLLKEKAAAGELNLAYLFPPMCFGEGAYVIPGQLRECLQKLQIVTDDEIVSKIFRKQLGGSPFAVHTDKLLDLLGLDKNGFPVGEKPTTLVKSETLRKTSTVSRSSRPKSIVSHLNDQLVEKGNMALSPGRFIVRPVTSIDNYMRYFDGDVADMIAKKLEKGQVQIIKAIKSKDPSSSGFITKPDLKDVFNYLGIPVRTTDLEHFLVRNGLRGKEGLVNYQMLLRRLQSRSNRGLLNAVVRNTDHMFHENQHPSTPEINATAAFLEVKLLDMFQREFLSMLSAFRQCDQSGTGFLTADEFKKSIENHCGIKINDNSWESFMTNAVKVVSFPSNTINEKGYVSYNDFLAKYDVMLSPTTADTDDPWLDITDDFNHLFEHRERYKKSMKVDLADHTHSQEPRPLEQLEATLVDVLLYKFRQFLREYDLCVREDYRRVDKEKFDYILFRCGFVLTPSELSRLWLSMPITRPMESLSIPTILQHVMRLYYASIKPGKFNKMSRDSAIVTQVLEKVRVPILTNWNMLKKKLRFLDPVGTSRILKEDMLSIMKGLELDINDMELHYLIEMLESRISGKTNYFRLMEYFSKTPKKIDKERPTLQLSDSSSKTFLDRQNNGEGQKLLKARQLNYAHASLPCPKPIYPFNRVAIHKPFPRPYHKTTSVKSTDANSIVTRFMRLKLNMKDLPALGRALRQEDKQNTGRISVNAFRKVLSNYGVNFNDPNHLYKCLSCYDHKMRNQVSYENFLQAIA